MPVSYEIAREAATIRAVTALRTPDATILATATITRSPVVVTNDGRWQAAIERARLPISLCRLDAFL
jgi:predicted nucleic acid-binding protein